MQRRVGTDSSQDGSSTGQKGTMASAALLPEMEYSVVSQEAASERAEHGSHPATKLSTPESGPSVASQQAEGDLPDLSSQRR